MLLQLHVAALLEARVSSNYLRSVIVPCRNAIVKGNLGLFNSLAFGLGTEIK